MLPYLIHTRNGKVIGAPPIVQVTNDRTLCDVMNEVSTSKEMFSEVINLLTIFFVIPVTTSTTERSFSVLRHLKTCLQTTMTQLWFNHCMILYIHKDKINEINKNEIAKTIMIKTREEGITLERFFLMFCITYNYYQFLFAI